MKKRLESELISIAHRILKLKNHSELIQLHLETQKLYETLSVLRFVEENINIIQPKIDVDNVEQKLEQVFDNSFKKEPIILSDTIFDAINNDTEPELKTDFDVVLATANEKIVDNQIISIDNLEIVNEAEVADADEEIIIKAVSDIAPAFELENSKVKPNKNEPVQVSFDEFKFEEPIFEKKSDIKLEKPAILNDKLTKGINIGLNDKVAFVKYLFADNSEDFNRVLSQINTFDSYLETVNFINNFVKPDYNNWNEKDEYVLRFMEAVEKKFV